MIVRKQLKINTVNEPHNKNKFVNLFSSMYWSSNVLHTEHTYHSSLQIKLLESVGLDREAEN